jgi:L-cystine uptake protein TcyP (sodium:dicarboxylate symporter family)
MEVSMEVLELVKAFFSDPFVRALIGFIALDFLLGVAAALRTKTFDFSKLADFYTSMVLPYILGYLAFYVATKLVIDPTILGDWANLVGEGVVKVAWLAIIGTLGKSIVDNIKVLGLGEAGQ